MIPIPAPALYGSLAFAFAIAFMWALFRSRPTLWEVGVIPMLIFSASAGNRFRDGASYVDRADFDAGASGQALYEASIKIAELRLYDTAQVQIACAYAFVFVVAALRRSFPDTDLGKALWSVMAMLEAVELLQRVHCSDPGFRAHGLSISTSACGVLYGSWMEWLPAILGLAAMLTAAGVQIRGNQRRQ